MEKREGQVTAAAATAEGRLRVSPLSANSKAASERLPELFNPIINQPKRFFRTMRTAIELEKRQKVPACPRIGYRRKKQKKVESVGESEGRRRLELSLVSPCVRRT